MSVFFSTKKFASCAKLFVSNLSAQVEEEELRGVLKQYGEVGEVQLSKKLETGRAYAFVRMDYRHNADQARTELNGWMFHDQKLQVRWALNNTTVWVGDIGVRATNEHLKVAFQQFGAIENVVVATDSQTNQSQGYGFVEFADVASARKAVQQTRDRLFLISSSPCPVRVELARIDNLEEDFRADEEDEEAEAVYSGRFAQAGTLEFEFARKWRELQQRQQAEKAQLKRVHAEERRQLFMVQAEHFRTEKDKLRQLEEMLRAEHQLPPLSQQPVVMPYGAPAPLPHNMPMNPGQWGHS